MKQFRLFAILVRPSLLGGIVSSALAVAIIGFSNWDAALQNPLMVEYIFGEKGLVTLLQNSPSSFKAFTEVAFSGSIAYNAVIVVIAILVGIGVYVLLEGFDHTKQNIHEAWLGLHDSSARFRSTVRSDIIFQIGTRILAIALWVVYLFVFLKILVPSGIGLSQQGLTTPDANPLDGLFAFIVLFLAMHGHVLIWRVLTLRPRLFGSKAIADQLLEQSQSH